MIAKFRSLAIVLTSMCCMLTSHAQKLYTHYNMAIGQEYLADASQTQDGGVAFVSAMQCGKIDAKGNTAWKWNFGSDLGFMPLRIIECSNRSFAIIGHIRRNKVDVSTLLKFSEAGTLTSKTELKGNFTAFAQTPDQGFLLLGEGGQLTRTNSSGKELWTKKLPLQSNLFSEASDFFSDRIISTPKGIYIIGGKKGTLRPSGTKTRSQDIVIIRIDDLGTVLWSRSIGGSGDELLRDAIFDSRDNSLAIFAESSSTDLIPGQQNQPGQLDNQHLWIAKTDMEGKLIWGSSSMEDSGVSYNGKSIEKDRNGGYVTASSSYAKGRNYAGGNGDGCIQFIDSSGKRTGQKLLIEDYGLAATYAVPHQGGYAFFGWTPEARFHEGDVILEQKEGSMLSFMSYMDTIAPTEIKFSREMRVPPSASYIRITLPREYTTANSEEKNKKFSTHFYSGYWVIFGGPSQLNITREPMKDYIDLYVADWKKGGYVMQWQEDGSQVFDQSGHWTRQSTGYQVNLILED